MWRDVGVTATFCAVCAAGAAFRRSYVCSILLALGEARLGLLAHDAAHRNHPAQWLYDFALGSHAQWKHKHHGGHHRHTNGEADPDVALAPLMRIRPSQPWRWYHRHQWWYQWGLFMGLPVLLRANGWAHVYRHLPLRSIVAHHVCAVPAAFLHLWYPYWQYGVVGWTHYALTSALLGLLYGALFSVSHVNDLVAFDVAPADWHTAQLRTTADWRPGCAWTHWLTVGLNHQVPHHLYPGHAYHSLLALREHLAPHPEYRAFDTFAEALRSNARHLKRMGCAKAQ